MEMATVKPELTIEQAELCKAALLAIRFQGTLPEMVQIVEKVHGTIKAIEEGLKQAAKDEQEPAAESPTPPEQ